VGGDADAVVRPTWVDEKKEDDERSHVAEIAASSARSAS
jgi:hypothetical protein